MNDIVIIIDNIIDNIIIYYSIQISKSKKPKSSNFLREEYYITIFIIEVSFHMNTELNCRFNFKYLADIYCKN